MIEPFYQNIQGWFEFKTIYDHAIKIMRNGSHYVEIGAWKGKSSAYMATAIANSNKNVRFDVIDTWNGSIEHANDILVKEDSLYEHFIDNMKAVEGYYKPIRLSSLEAAAYYMDESIDFCFIDAAHDYDNVKADILAWYPKVKPGGVIAGDDYYTPMWPGLTSAVDEILPDRRIIETSWIHYKI